MRLSFPLRVLALIALLVTAAFEQSPNGTVSGLVSDPSGSAIANADIQVLNDVTGVRYPGATNGEGVYAITNLPPGPYRIQVSKPGFKTLIKPDIVLSVQGALAINFSLPIGALSETVTVEGGAPLVNTESAAVSTVVDRQFAENLPMNGRSFQSLIELTPGVVLTPSTNFDSGQFSVSGQRPDSNYWMLDGVSANIGISANNNPGNGFGGTLGSFSAQGGTNSLVSVDALQEFRIQTSTYAPEFGRTPGGQISIVTRSGSNQLHGTLFDYFRNDVLDANDWFANSVGLVKPQERQNDFGGTFSGPILKNRTFFFLSYEGLRLRLPQTGLTTVPSLTARQSAIPALQPFLNAYPAPNGPDLGGGIAPFNATYSDKSSLDAYSIRADQRVSDKLTLFGRYNYSPSSLLQRAGAGLSLPLNDLASADITTHTVTVGAAWTPAPEISDDLRFNYSRTNASSSADLDNFGGAVPLTSLPLPSPFTSQNAGFFFTIFSLERGEISVGKFGHNLQRQINIVDNLSWQKGSHSLKFGADYRRLSPVFDSQAYSQDAAFSDVPSAQAGNLFFTFLTSNRRATLLFRELSVFGQDTWRVSSRLTLTYGLRWELDFVPTSEDGPSLPAATGYNLNDLSSLALAPAGTPPFRTSYGNVAPRVGVAYQVSQRPRFGNVLRGGFGVFFDLATGEVGTTLGTSYPFGGRTFSCCFNGTFPLDSASAAPPPISPDNLSSSTLYVLDPHLRLPYTLGWNLAFEQELGTQQTFVASYVGSTGRRLLQSAFISSPNSNLGSADLIGNTASSAYDALQVQYRRRLSVGLQALASYTWAHSIDDGSAGSYGSGGNALVPGASAESNRGPSDFDVRNAFSAGITYEVPTPRLGRVSRSILRGWSLQNMVQGRSAVPVNVFNGEFSRLLNAATQVRPDLVPGEALYVYGSQFAGGKRFNASAFTSPPTDPTTGAPLRQGDLGRNALRGFGALQWDLAVHRDFPIRDLLKLQFRAEVFNLLNHPNFGQPIGDTSDPQFGRSIAMLNHNLSDGNVGGGAFSPLYQVGGPRSIQLALKLQF